MLVCDSFSADMLPEDCDFVRVCFTKLTLEQAKNLINSRQFDSFVGTKTTASAFSNLLNCDIAYNNDYLQFKYEDDLLLGPTKKNEKNYIEWFHITLTKSLM